MPEPVVSVDVSESGRQMARFRLGDPKVVRAPAGSIRLTGRMPPLRVARMGSRLVLVDGFKRLRAARLCGWERVPVIGVETDEPSALVLPAQLNRRGRVLSAIEEGWVVFELHHRFGQTLERIAARFGRDQSWATRREQLVVRLEPEVQGLIREGGLDPSAAEELVNMPRGIQWDLARRAAGTHLSVARIRALIGLIRQAPDPAHCRYVLDHPQETLNLLGHVPTGADPWSRLESHLKLILHAAALGPLPDPAHARRLRTLLAQAIQPPDYAGGAIFDVS